MIHCCCLTYIPGSCVKNGIRKLALLYLDNVLSGSVYISISVISTSTNRYFCLRDLPLGDFQSKIQTPRRIQSSVDCDSCSCYRWVFIAVVLAQTFQRGKLLAQIAHVIVSPAWSVSLLVQIPGPMGRKNERNANIRLPRNISGMASRIVEVILEAIKSVSIIPFNQGFRCRVIPPVAHGVHVGSEELAPLASPNTELHLVVGVVRSRVVQYDVSGLEKCAHVSWYRL